MSSTSDHCRLALSVVVSGWPRVSEVFALNELLALHRRGMLAAVLATKPGETGPQHPAVAEIDHLVEVLTPGDHDHLAEQVAKRVAETGATGVHGYFAHEPAAVAAAAADRCGLPYGFSVHALDARKVAPADLAERARAAALVVACNRDAAAEVEAVGTQPTLLRHGVDLDRVPGHARRQAARPVQLLAVGRMVEKKGFDVLLAALALVDRPVRLRIVGTGVLRPRDRGGHRRPRPGRPGRAARPAHPCRAPGRVRARPTSSSCRRSSTEPATATDCPTSCSRPWRAAGR